MSNRRNKRGGGGGEGGEERWLLPYADMITLLLGLFIVLFAMSSIDAKQFDNVKRSLAQTFKGSVLTESGGVMPGASGVLDPTAANQSPDNTKIAMREEASNATKEIYADEQEKFEKIVKDGKLEKDVTIEPDQRGFVISIAGDALFDSGQYTLRPEAKTRLEKIARELIAFDRKIVIEGHTDRVPFPGEFGNLGLSGDRAMAVQYFLAGRGMSHAKMVSEAKGEWDPKVKSANRNVPANRRIEILVLAPGVNDAGLPGSKPQITKAVASAATPVKRAAPVSKTNPNLEAQVDRKITDDILAPVVGAAGGDS